MIWSPARGEKIQQEAQSMTAQEPMLASFFHSTILNHRDLRSALSFQLANKLDSTTMPAIALREVIELALRSEPELLAAVAADICAVQERDPAVDLFSTPLLYLKGFHALQATGSPTGCGARVVVPWHSICKTRSPWCSGRRAPGRPHRQGHHV